MSKALSALGVPSSPGTYSAALEGLTKVNEVLMRRDPSIPPLYTTGTQWEIRPGDPTEKEWRYAPDVVTTGWGDCQDLSAYRAAELRVTGADPAASVRVYPTGENRYHAVVARGNGLVEDPSVILGMPPIREAPMSTLQLPAVQGAQSRDVVVGAVMAINRSLRSLHPNVSGGCFGPEISADPLVCRVKDVAPEVSGPTFHVTPHRSGSVNGYKGVNRIPLKDGTAIVGMTKTYRNPADCIGDGASLISRIGDFVADHPAVLALVSPPAAIAAMALKDPGTRFALDSTGKAAKDAAKQSGGGDGWAGPVVWGAPLPNRGGGFTGPGGGGRPAGQAPGNFVRALAGMRGGGVSQQNPASQPTAANPAVNPQNPYNTPGLPGYNPGLPSNTYGSTNPQNPYNTPGLPGYNPALPSNTYGTQYAPGYNPWNPQPQQSGGFYGGGTAADYGIPDPYGGAGDGGGFGSGYVPQAADYSALQSYEDPTSQIGPWNYGNGGYY